MAKCKMLWRDGVFIFQFALIIQMYYFNKACYVLTYLTASIFLSSLFLFLR